MRQRRERGRREGQPGLSDSTEGAWQGRRPRSADRRGRVVADETKRAPPPGLSRGSTSLSTTARKQDVDGGNKSDQGGQVRRHCHAPLVFRRVSCPASSGRREPAVAVPPRP